MYTTCLAVQNVDPCYQISFSTWALPIQGTPNSRVATAPTYLTPANGSDVIFCKASCLIFDFSKHKNYKKTGSLPVVGVKYAEALATLPNSNIITCSSTVRPYLCHILYYTCHAYIPSNSVLSRRWYMLRCAEVCKFYHYELNGNGHQL